MNQTALEVCDISKHYQLKQKDTEQKEFAALDKISFTANKGELIGIIGKNGSGKSTLLKILSGITKPTLGTIKIHGSIHSILDIGSNFHPDLTGLENIEMSLSLSQRSASEIAELTKKIITFSEIGDFINSPVKHYSNGMFLRLAFSVALNSDADILLLDEVLQVGDVEFKSRSLNLVQSLALSGKTILIASHDIQEITKLCTRCIWIEKGKINMDGKTTAVTTAYYQMHEPQLQLNNHNKFFNRTSSIYHEWEFTEAQKITNDQVHIKRLAVEQNPQRVDLVTDLALKITLEFDILKPELVIIPLFAIRDSFNKPLFMASPTNNLNNVNLPNYKNVIASFIIPSNFLHAGVYYLSVGFEVLNDYKFSDMAFIMSDILFPLDLKREKENTMGILSAANITPSFEWHFATK